MKAVFLLCGLVFGFLLSRARATDVDTMIRFFRLTDLHIAGVMAVAIAVAAVGLRLLSRSGAKAVAGCPIEIPSKPMRSGIVPAGILFGAGWALTGT
jgi:hypothetical protein